MKRLFVLQILILGLYGIKAAEVTPLYSIQGKDSTCQIFIYSPGESSGLHLAYKGQDADWHDVGQLCTSDYSRWGSEKRMYAPYVIHANDGTWRAIWAVNNYAPCFAVAYSEDLVTWRPQDYPRLSVGGCKETVMFQMPNGMFDIYLRTKSGIRYVQASNDFRHFKEAEEAAALVDAAWVKDTVYVSGKPYAGNLFDIPKIHLQYIRNYFAALKADAELSSERMTQDTERFKDLSPTVSATLIVNNQKEKAISDKLIGVFFEDISYAADGGIYAELVQNRDFEYSSKDRTEWKVTTAWQSTKPLVIASEQPLSKSNPHHVVLSQDTLVNNGWDGIAIKPGEKYDFSFFVRNLDVTKKTFQITLIAENGDVIASQQIKTEGQIWKKYTATLITKVPKELSTYTDFVNCRLAIIPLKKGSSAVDMISLFPQNTFKGRKNGLRKDLAQVIADLHPKFVRFPGGCATHGDGIDNIYHWYHTIGELHNRIPDRNIWGYHQTRGLGFYEYFQFCEDIGAEPFPVLAAGVPCQNSGADRNGIGGQQCGIDMKDMPTYIEEFFNLIEWANGDPATNKWAKMRAEAGHPAPFHLKYIGVGNEDLISTTFKERYLMICKAIKEKYPEIVICGTAGPFHTPSSDYIEGWEIANANRSIIDMIDEHYYESTGWFINHTDYYDQYDHKGAKVYLGEYAASTQARRSNVETALAEAVYLCHIERNGDIVEMASYAPLLAKDNHRNWDPNLIYFTNTDIRTTPSYETQRIFSLYGGDRYIETSVNIDERLKNRVAVSVVRDSKSGKTHLKMVNALPRELKLDIRGLQLPATATAEGFMGNPDDQNLKVKVSSPPINGSILTLPPYSLNAITL